MGIACSSAAIFCMQLSHHCWANTEVTHAAVKAGVDSGRPCHTFPSPEDTCTETEEAKTISGCRPTSGCVSRSNRPVTRWGTADLYQQISHHGANIISALLTMKTWIVCFSSLTVEPSDADGFNKHSKENWCSCSKVIQENEHVHPPLRKHRIYR